MKQKKYLFIDRDGTLISEPSDFQIDSVEKLNFVPGVFSALTLLLQHDYRLVMVSNQDGLGTQSFPYQSFDRPHQLMLKIFHSQGIEFDDVLICPHLPTASCECRKPKVGMLLPYLIDQSINQNDSYVVGDRESDVHLAQNLGVTAFQIGSVATPCWQDIAQSILNKPRQSIIHRQTRETNISLQLNLDQRGETRIETGIGFFDHLLQQVAQHADISLSIKIQGDLAVDDHHVIEDTAIVLGDAIRIALGEKRGIARYGFLLPMDEALTTIALDLGGRSHCQFSGTFHRERVGTLATEMIPHFFKSLSESLKASLHIKLEGENDHHRIESAFKAFGRVLRQAISKEPYRSQLKLDSMTIPSTKGVL